MQNAPERVAAGARTTDEVPDPPVGDRADQGEGGDRAGKSSSASSAEGRPWLWTVRAPVAQIVSV